MKTTFLPLLAALGLCAAAGSATAQHFPETNGLALEGVDTFDAVFNIAGWLDVAADQDRFRANGQSAFELALRRDAVRVDDSAPNYLFCEVAAAQDFESGKVYYQYDVQYYAYNPDGVHALLWESGAVVSIAAGAFTPDEVAKDCADEFANEWLKQNPK